MSVKVVLEFDSAAEAAAFLQDSDGETEETGAPAAAGTGKPRGRPRKTAPAPAAPAAAPAAAAAAVAPAAPAAAAPAAPAAVAVPYATVAAKLTELMELDYNSCKVLLEGFGVQAANKLPPERYGEVLQAAEKQIAALKPAPTARPSLI